MKKYCRVVLLIFGLGLTSAYAQVGMMGNNPNKDATLDLNNSDGTAYKGLLMPRVALSSTASALPMSGHVEGMHVYNIATAGSGATAVSPGEYYSDGTQWLRVSANFSAWQLDGNTNSALKTLGTKDNFDLPFVTNNTEKMRLTTAGFLGVNTTSPTALINAVANNVTDFYARAVKLDSYSPNMSEAFSLLFSRSRGTLAAPVAANAGDNLGVIAFRNNGSTVGSISGVKTGTATNDGSLSFIAGPSGLEKMFVHENGVAIGVGSGSGYKPNNALTVLGVSDNILRSTVNIQVPYTASGGGGHFYLDRMRGDQISGMTNSVKGDNIGSFAFRPYINGSFMEVSGITSTYRGDGTTNLSDIQFGTSGGTKMLINELGNVSIGTGIRVPAQKLDVDGFTQSSGYIVKTAPGSNALEIYANSATPYDPGDIVYRNYDGTERVRIESGTASAAQLNFAVTNAVGARMAMTFNNVGDLWVSGKVFASGVQLTSDERFKKNIVTIDNALDKVLKLRGTEYDWKAPQVGNNVFDTTKHQLGVIAQEVQKIVPEAVIQKEDGYYSVDYNKLTPLLIEAVKEQQKQIEKQQDQIKALQDTVEKLLRK